MSNHGTFNNYGTSENYDNFNNSGTLTSTGTYNNFMDFTNQSYGIITNSGIFENGTEAEFRNYGTFNNNSLGTVNNLNLFISSGTINNSGMINNSYVMSNDGTIENYGAITNSFMMGNTGTITNYGLVKNDGFFYNADADSGTFNNFVILQNNGTFYNTYDGATGTFNNYGTYHGIGTFVGNLDSGIGIIAPGNSAGTMKVEGNFLLSSDGTIEIEIGGFEDGEYDFLDITGSATLLDGDINFSFLDGYDISTDILPGQTESFMFLYADEGIVVDMSSINYEFSGTPNGFVYNVYNVGNTSLWFEATNTIPAPGAFLLSCIGIGCIERLKRRRKI